MIDITSFEKQISFDLFGRGRGVVKKGDQGDDGFISVIIARLLMLLVLLFICLSALISYHRFSIL